MFGMANTIFGSLVVFNDTFLAYMKRKWWTDSDISRRIFPGKSIYFYDRYVTGLSSLILGLIFLATALIMILD
jgi:hypothetical protein